MCPKYLVCPRWVAGRVGSGSDLEVAVAQGEGVQGAGERRENHWEFAGKWQQRLCSCQAPPAFPGTLGEAWGLCSCRERESKAVPGRALHSMPTAASSQAGPQPGSFLSLSSLRWLQWLHWGMERPIWGQG